MLRNLYERVRFEILRRLNPYRSRRNYRWARVKNAARIRIVLRSAMGAERELSLRADSSDFLGFLQVFDPCQYDTGQLRRDADLRGRYEAIIRSGKVPLLIDAGANIGMAALYFRDVYPEAAILCLEPEASNFAELSRHVAGDDRILALHAALGGRDGAVEISDPGLGELGFRTSPAHSTSPAGIPAYSVASLLRMAHGRWPVVPFFLKIDIEGAESDVFEFDVDVVDQFYAIMIELHDWMLPKQRTATRCLAPLVGRDRDFILMGENILSVSNDEPTAGLNAV